MHTHTHEIEVQRVSRLLEIGVMNESYYQAQKDVSSKCRECQILIDAMFFCCKSLYSVSVANCTGTKSSSLTRSDTICVDFSLFLSLGLFLLGRGVWEGEISPKFDLKNMISTYTKDFSWRN
jgi:hypothetical protein